MEAVLEDMVEEDQEGMEAVKAEEGAEVLAEEEDLEAEAPVVVDQALADQEDMVEAVKDMAEVVALEEVVD